MSASTNGNGHLHSQYLWALATQLQGGGAISYAELESRLLLENQQQPKPLTREQVIEIAQRVSATVTAGDGSMAPGGWRELFKTYDQMETKDLASSFLISQFLIEGVTMLGALSGAGKTWLALSMSKALTTGRPFLGVFEVPQIVPVIYMIPEVQEARFKERMRLMGIKDNFYCRTLNAGTALPLNHAGLLEAVQELHPLVVLDTAVRFSTAISENDALANARGIADGCFGMIRAGARAALGLHHATKLVSRKGKDTPLTSEEILRGTGDIIAMADAIYGMRMLDQKSTVVRVECTKPREFEPVDPFVIQGRPYINEIGDFKMLVGPNGRPVVTVGPDRVIPFLGQLITQKPGINRSELTKAVKANEGFPEHSEHRIRQVLEKGEGTHWKSRRVSGNAGREFYPITADLFQGGSADEFGAESEDEDAPE